MADESGHGDPVEYFLEDISGHGRSARTVDAYERVLREFRTTVRERREVESLGAAEYRDCMAWLDETRAGRAESTVATYATYVHRFYDYMNQVGVFETNPMGLVMAELDESIGTDPTRRDLSVADMRRFVGLVTHPLDRAVICTLLKTGIRSGELCNLDLRDLNLPDCPARLHDGVEPRAGLQSRPDSLFVASDPTRGRVTNGERRNASNKRKRETIVPIDSELRRILTRWLAIRPDPVSSANPLFVSTRNKWGDRLTTNMVHHLVERWARRVGWYREGGSAEENVTPHYFRHFFTTHLRDRTGDRGVVKYLRGDVARDVIDTYTHNWGDRVREVYEANIYSIL